MKARKTTPRIARKRVGRTQRGAVRDTATSEGSDLRGGRQRVAREQALGSKRMCVFSNLALCSSWDSLLPRLISLPASLKSVLLVSFPLLAASFTSASSALSASVSPVSASSNSSEF